MLKYDLQFSSKIIMAHVQCRGRSVFLYFNQNKRGAFSHGPFEWDLSISELRYLLFHTLCTYFTSLKELKYKWNCTRKPSMLMPQNYLQRLHQRWHPSFKEVPLPPCGLGQKQYHWRTGKKQVALSFKINTEHIKNRLLITFWSIVPSHHLYIYANILKVSSINQKIAYLL